MNPADLTPEFCLSVEASVTVWCEGCRSVRPVAVEKLPPGRPIPGMKFRCAGCGGPGYPSVTAGQGSGSVTYWQDPYILEWARWRETKVGPHPRPG